MVLRHSISADRFLRDLVVWVVCPPECAEDLVAMMRRHPLGRDAAIIGEVRADEHRFVEMETAFGGNRLVDWLSSDPLPRIC